MSMSGISPISSTRVISVSAGVPTVSNTGSADTKNLAQNVGEALKEAQSNADGDLKEVFTSGNIMDAATLAKVSEVIAKRKISIDMAVKASTTVTSGWKTLTSAP